MAATQQQTGNRTQTTAAPSLLEQVLAQPVGKRFKEIDTALQERIDAIEDVLPANMRGKGEGARLAKMAIMTLNRKADLYGEVSPASFVRCVLEAANFGLAIDGRFGHAVPFNNTVIGRDGKKLKVKEVQFMPDYKGIVAVAKRNGVIKDCWGRLIGANDRFEMREVDGECHYTHEPSLIDPGPAIGVLAIVKLPSGEWRYEWMNMHEIDEIRKRSKSWQAGGGPWKTDDGEMRKKTCIKRAMKMYGEDATLARLIELDDRDYEQDEVRAEPAKVPRRQRVKDFSGNGHEAPAAETIKQEAAGEIDDNERWTTETQEGDANEAFDEEASVQAAMQLQDAIDAAENQAEMREVGAQLKAAKAVLGEAIHETLLKQLQEKNKRMGVK